MDIEHIEAAIKVPTPKWLSDREVYIRDEVERLGGRIQDLLAAAEIAFKNSTRPAAVAEGVAILTHSGRIFSAPDESAVCEITKVPAESAAIMLAKDEEPRPDPRRKGSERFIRAVAFCTQKGELVAETLGNIAEYADDAVVVLSKEGRQIRMVTSLYILLYAAFLSRSDLGKRE